MKFRILLYAAALLLAFSCTSDPEEKIESNLKQVQSTLPKDLGSGVTYTRAFYDRESNTIVFGYTVENMTAPFEADVLNALKYVTVQSLSTPRVARDPIWKFAARANATFRYEYYLQDGSPGGSYTLTKKDYAAALR